MDNRDISNLYVVIYELIKGVKLNISGFKCLNKNKSFKKVLSNIEVVYMNSIILDISKLINATKSDKTGLEQLRSCLSVENQNKIDTLRKTCKNNFKKISANRNRIIAHIDISSNKAYWNMGISKTEIQRIIGGYKKSYFYDNKILDKDDQFIKNIWNIEAKSKDNERYNLSDFRKDVPKLNKILNKIEIINESLLEVLKKTN